MIIVCPRCGILYSVDAAAFAGGSQTMQCSNCAHEWLHAPDSALPDSAEALRLLALSVGGRQGTSVERPAPALDALDAGALAGVLADVRAKTAEPKADERRSRDDAELLRQPAAARREKAASGGEPVRRDPVDEEPPAAAPLRGQPAMDADVEPDEILDEEESEPAPLKPERLREPSPRGRERAAKDPAAALTPPPDHAVAALDATIPPAPFGEEAAAGGKPPVAHGPSRRPRTAVIATGAVAATLLISVGLLAATRTAVISTFPGAAGFYSAIGLAPAADFAAGLEIRDVSSSRSWNDDGQVLTVAGDLANIAAQPRMLPMVRVVLVDKSDAEVQEVVVLPPGETLPVGESVRFEARITDPADSAERIKVSLAPRPEPS